MRLRAILFTLIALAGVGFGAERLARAGANYVERRTATEAAGALAAAGETWASVRTDGLVVTLTGAAPDEASRLRAAEILRRIVDPRRLRDQTALARQDPRAAPPFALELLRNQTEVSLIGLAPETAGRDAIKATLARSGLDGTVSDMLESVAHPAPAGWDAALAFGLSALADLPRAKISITPGHVAISALADTGPARRAMEAALRAARPDGVALDLDIAAPRPIVTPFALRFELAGGTPALTACTAETEGDADAFAKAAGLPDASCRLGLGAPSPEWASASISGIQTVRALGGGVFALDDFDATLFAPAEAAEDRVDAVAAALDAALPAPYLLSVVRPAEPVGSRDPVEAAPHFAAELDEDGAVRLSGGVQDAASREAIASYAAALFGADRVTNATEVASNLPEGWPGRVLTGIEALALLKEGGLDITPERVVLTGLSEQADGAARARALFEAKDIAAPDLAVRFDAAAAAAEAAAKARAADPVGACLDAVAAIERSRVIAFRPGSAELEAAGAAVVAALAAVMADCPPLDFEIGGHTDSQGRAESNQRLSEDRARAVKAALDAAGLPQMRFVARGYGAAAPVTENATEAGRARNRRIEFTLIADKPPPPPPAAEAAPEPAPEPAGEPVPEPADEPANGSH